MPQTFSTDAIVRFGDFEVDPGQATVRRNGAAVSIQEKPLQLLLALLDRPGQLITREELRNRLWPADAFGAFEDGLNTAVRKLRIALNDSAEIPQFIETVPKRGYRFIAPVSAVVNPANVPDPETSGLSVQQALPDEVFSVSDSMDSKAKGRSRRWKASIALLALTLLIVAIRIGQIWRARNQPAQGTPSIASLAVLPMANLTGDPSQNYFVDGMTDELTTSLAQIGGLKVISETSAKHYRETNKPLRQIAEELGVDAIVEGSVARFGDQVRITAQLINAKEDRHLWAESFSGSGSDALGLQHDVAKAIADQIHLTLTPAEEYRMRTLPTRNQSAYDAYLHAKYLVGTALNAAADANAAIAEAERAVALDPEFAEAYVVAAQSYQARMFSWGGGKKDDEKAFVALGKALALNPNLAEAYLTRGSLYYTHFHSFDIVNAIADYRRAVSLNPNFAEAHHNLGSELTHSGLHDRAIEEFRTALQLDPQNDGAKFRLSRALWQSQRFDEALQNYDRYNLKNSEKALTLAYLGHRKQAWETIEELEPQAGQAWRPAGDIAAVRAFLYATEASPRKAEQEMQIASRQEKNDAHFHHTAFILAATCAEMGKPHEAVAWLRHAAETGMPNYPLFHDNPSMSKLHGNPEYEQFMAQFKARWDPFAASL